MTFQIHALDPARFAPLFEMDDATLTRSNARRVTVTHAPGFPCRVSLTDAPVGEAVILTNFTHMPEASPFRASHAIYLRKDVAQAHPAPGEVPDLMRSRLGSIRGFDATHQICAAEVVEGTALEDALETMFADDDVAYIHIHNAKLGCFTARMTRATA